MLEAHFRRSRRQLPSELEDARQRIEGIAKQHGLDFFDTIFEMCVSAHVHDGRSTHVARGWFRSRGFLKAEQGTTGGR